MIDSDSRVVSPSLEISGTIRVPGDKSISHRVAMLSGLASGESVIEGFLTAEDCINTLRSVEMLGASVSRHGDFVKVVGTGGKFNSPKNILDMGNSGTGMRLLAGLLAGQNFVSEMTGDDSLRSRPMKRIKEPLEMMGAAVELLGRNGCAPVRIRGGNLHAIEYKSPVASAQVKSCVLFAGLFANGTTTVVEPKATRDHTEKVLKGTGVPVKCDGLRISLDGYGSGGPKFNGRKWFVPGDFSSAAFWLVAAAASEGSQVTVENVGLNPRRTALLDVLKRMGAEVEVRGQANEVGNLEPDINWEPVGTVTVRGRGLKCTEIGGDEIPNLIDELPVVAVAGALADGRTVIRDASELRVKESDRIATMAKGLSALGVKVEEKPDGMIISGKAKIKGGTEVDSKGDHRIAMSMAMLSFFADNPVRIHNVACINTSYPGFWDHLRKLTGSND
ncbi:MAG: 3-phosphoshikimate 1-carboxyvinyltransferase [Kiritimatiellae bacterium]|nr:3-phosphoshikimate 1-carboxyvinyltransferase [Kiritimatiellia bacterium]